jgi:hypothetical protein
LSKPAKEAGVGAVVVVEVVLVAVVLVEVERQVVVVVEVVVVVGSEHIIQRVFVRFVDRFKRTVREAIWQRRKGMDLTKWKKLLPDIVIVAVLVVEEVVEVVVVVV